MKIARWQDDHTPDEMSLRKQLESEGYSVYVWTDRPGSYYSPHTHDDDQSHWILQGNLSLTVAGQEYVLGPGDRDWLPAGTLHEASVMGHQPVTYLIASKRNLP